MALLLLIRFIERNPITLIYACYPMFYRFHRAFRTIEQSTTRTSRELDIRRNLRDWDNHYPEIHHELIVRWVCGAVVSLTVTSLYNGLKRELFASGRRDPYRRY
jgi:hypothetical protein